MGVVDGPGQRAAAPSDIPKKVLLWQKVTFLMVYPLGAADEFIP